ncbi:hypothetical protein MG290_08715 [Flavobacterium sp. CBA20B-1]|uniref:DUF6933 domain-containing protein n=1 Tax=unclassified Flavobacterium TaxID=196869 RepID=UPI002224D099|nr:MULTISPECIES: hypothetical protein [unclassified Flavobacterium]WCM41041.1 hypothetical protein MG290_08715 [Flavobacterium sp. CBA20B-1]
MNFTQVYTTRKLEKTIAKSIVEKDEPENKFLGEWVATIFYVDRKKCWLIVNKLTKYLLILSDIKTSELNNITGIFTKTLHSQLKHDGIEIEYGTLREIIGEIKLCETNNDRSANGSLNNCMFSIDHWKMEYGGYENLPFRKINSGLNSSPNKILEWKYPKEVMNEIIKAYLQQRL